MRLGIKPWELSECKLQLGQWVGLSQEDGGGGRGEGQSRSQGSKRLQRAPTCSQPEAWGTAEKQMPQRGHDPWGQNISPLLSDLEFKRERRSGFREVVVGSQRLTAHEFQNLSPSGR